MQAFCKVFFVSLLLFQYFKGHLCGEAAVWVIGYRQLAIGYRPMPLGTLCGLFAG